MSSGKSSAKNKSRKTDPAEPASHEEQPAPHFPVVGIGASAGGLEAFKQFFSTVPGDSGIAFILVQHLDPSHESMMVELLSKYTPMKVVQAGDDMKLAPDHIYMIPPNHYLEVQDRKLKLREPVKHRGMRMPIDFLFHSLALEWKERAICIVLSGTGSDGALGLKAIKAQGGMAMVEDPDSAGYDGMPRAAIHTGLVDFILHADKMSDTLMRYIEHPYIAEKGAKSLAAGAPADHFTAIMSLLRTRTGYNFTCYKKGTLHRRIDRRLGLHQLNNLGDYAELLRTSEEEVQLLFQDLLIGVTSFFRDNESWQFIEEVLQQVIAAKEFDEPVRVWVAGCTTGEEAYSIAMILFEQFEAAKKSCNAQIFATDINEQAIERARAGKYPHSIAADVSPERLNRFFEEEGEAYVVKKKVRESVVFAVQNLISDPPFSKLDLICCRNVLIYLENPIQDQIIEMFHFALGEKGLLFLGDSESVGKYAEYFESVSKTSKVFRKKGRISGPGATPPVYAQEEAHSAARKIPKLPHRAGGGISELARDLILERFAPAAVLISRNFEISYFHGPTNLYLNQPSGEPTRDLSVLCAKGLKSKLRTAVHQAAAEDKIVVTIANRVKRNDSLIAVRLTVEPLNITHKDNELFLVTFEDEPEPTTPSDRGTDIPPEQLDAVEQIEYELQATREDLQSTIEELETSNEELKASNEEVMSMNEELQSTNEELETSREELQSLNEELSTVNSQLEDKVREVESTNNDLFNLLNSTDIATIFLDTNFRIRRFTPATRDLVRLIDSDIGRPFSDIAQRFTDEDLLSDAQKVLERLSPIECEISTGNDQSYIRRIVPYRTGDNRIEGVVITFSDISKIRIQTDKLREREQQHDIVAKLGQSSLNNTDIDQIFHSICPEISRVLKVPLVKILQYEPAKHRFTLRAGHGWKENIKPGKTHVSASRGSQAGYTIESRYPVIVEDLGEEKRFSGPELLLSHKVASGISVIIGTENTPWGVLGIHTDKKRSFSVDDVNFLQSVANILSATITRRDITTRHQRIIDSVSDGFALIDSDYRFTYFNNTAETLAGISREKLLGKTIFEAFPEVRDSAFHKAISSAMESGQSTELTEYYAPHEKWYETTYYPTDDGGVSLIFSDVTAARAYRRQLQLALDSGKMGVWQRNLSTKKCTLDKRMCELLDLDPEIREFTRDQILEQLHYDDKELLRDYCDKLKSGKKPDTLEFRTHSKGEMRWLSTRGTSVTDHEGKPIHLSGIAWDITEVKTIEEKLRNSNEQLEKTVDERTRELRILTENVPAYFAYVDSDLRYQFVNREYEKLFRQEKKEIVGRHVTDIMSDENYSEIRDRLKSALSGEQQQFEIVLNIPLDGIRTISARYVPHVEKGGKIRGVFILANDITEERRLQQEVLEATELEKERIGRDLHDGICQELAGIGLFGKAMSTSLKKRDASESDDAEALVKQINELTQKARKLARGLSPVALENCTLPQALTDLAENLDDLIDGSCRYEGSTDVDLEPAVASQFYLIAREATMNAIRHGSPENVVISLSRRGGAVFLSVIDDGSGNVSTIKEGLGLRSMRYRARILGGSLKIQQNPEGKGIKIICRMKTKNLRSE